MLSPTWGVRGETAPGGVLRRGGRSPFTPLSLAPVLWLDKNKGVLNGNVAAAVAEPVSEWQDQSGNGRHATQAVFSKRAILSAQGVDLDGVDDFMLIPFMAGLTSASLFIVAVFPGLAGAYSMFETNNNSSYWHWPATGTGYIGTFRNARIEEYPPAPNPVGNHIYSLFSGSQFEVFVDGVSKGVQPGDFSSGNGDPYRLGRQQSDLPYHADVTFKEVLIFGSVLSDDERTKVTQYLAKKHGIALP